MPGQFLPPDHSAGDPNTIGGYMAVHGRPAAFEGSDGMSYSVAIEAARNDDEARPWGAYYLFLRWRRIGPQGVEGHLETDFLAFGPSADAASSALGAMPLNSVREELERLIAARRTASDRRWWDAMREEGDDDRAPEGNQGPDTGEPRGDRGSGPGSAESRHEPRPSEADVDRRRNEPDSGT
jgi:hypothetical protein